MLLIEAGGSDLNNANIRIPLHAASLQLSYEDWAYYTVPQKHSQRAMNEQVLIINYNRSSLRRSRLTSYSCSYKPIIPVIMVYPNINNYIPVNSLFIQGIKVQSRPELSFLVLTSNSFNKYKTYVEF